MCSRWPTSRVTHTWLSLHSSTNRWPSAPSLTASLLWGLVSIFCVCGGEEWICVCWVWTWEGWGRERESVWEGVCVVWVYGGGGGGVEREREFVCGVCVCLKERMCVCVCVWLQLCRHMFCVRVCAYTVTYVCVYIYTYVCVDAQLCMRVYIHNACVCAWERERERWSFMHTCVCVCLCIVYIYMFVSIWRVFAGAHLCTVHLNESLVQCSVLRTPTHTVT